MYLTGTVFKVLKNMKKKKKKKKKKNSHLWAQCTSYPLTRSTWMYMFYATRSQVYYRFDTDLTLHTQKQIHIVHRGTKRLK